MPCCSTEIEREQLNQIINRHSTPQQIILRANIILLADQGQNHREIAWNLNISRDMARLWRNRWLKLSIKEIPAVERLVDSPSYEFSLLTPTFVSQPATPHN